MTDKEKEAIEYFKKRIDICMENANICDDNDFDEEATCLRKEQILTETVLNLIQTQQAEIEKKDKIIDLMLEEFTDCEFELKCSECCYECERDYDQLYMCNKEYFERKIKEEK